VNFTTNTISGTSDPALFKDWRYGPTGSPLIYTFNSIPNGSYNMTLDFVEAKAPAVGSRVFNVSINGITVLSNFDIYQTAGPNTAYSRTFSTTVGTGQIVIQFTPVTTAYPPIVSAIQIQ
jgi:hypothetical protein